MKKFFLIVFLVMCLLFIAACDDSEKSDVNAIVVAHRGYHDNSTVFENSLDSFRYAVLYGYEWAELDLWCTSDGKLVVTHDNSLKRVWKVDKNVENLTLAELRLIATKEQVLEFADVWKIAQGKLKLQLEIKDSDAVTPVLNFFNTCKCYDDCIVISFDGDCLECLKNGNSNIICGYLANSYDPRMLSYSWADVLALKYTALSQQIVANIHLSGKKVFAWTVDSLSDIQTMDSWRVDSITTNKPWYCY